MIEESRDTLKSKYRERVLFGAEKDSRRERVCCAMLSQDNMEDYGHWISDGPSRHNTPLPYSTPLVSRTSQT